MKIKNDYVKIKQGKKEIELHNLILNRYLNLFAYSLLNNVEKGLHVCLINCTSEETITPSMSTMNYDFVLEEDNRYNNDDYKDKNKIITKYLYSASQQTTITPYLGRKIYSIGFGQESTSNNSDDYELYAILDVSNYNLYIQESQNFIVERVDTVTTDLKFDSETETFPIHLSPRGKAWIDQTEGIGTHEIAKLNRVWTGYSPANLDDFVKDYNPQYSQGQVNIRGANITKNSSNELYPSNSIYPSNSLYPKVSQKRWIIYEFLVYKFVDTVTGYVSTGRKYYMSKYTNVTGDLLLQLKYERG